MYNPLAVLVIVFIAMTLFSAVGLVLMFLLKDEKKQKVAFYFLAVTGMTLAYFNARSTPATLEFIFEIIRGWILGGMSASALLLQLCGKKENHFKIAKILVTIAVVGGIIETFVV